VATVAISQLQINRIQETPSTVPSDDRCLLEEGKLRPVRNRKEEVQREYTAEVTPVSLFLNLSG
jgi:hypothetical protein